MQLQFASEGRHLLLNYLFHSCFLVIHVPYQFLGLEKILATTAVKPFAMETLLLSIWMEVSMDTGGNLSPSKIPLPYYAALTSALSLG